MKDCTFLTGVNVKPAGVAAARDLIGRRVVYLTTADIDNSGRGYFFPKHGTVTDAHMRHIEIDNDRFVRLNSVVEMTLATDPQAPGDKL